LVNAATFELQQFVSQCGNARWRQIGLLVKFGKKVAGVRLKGHDAGGHAAMSRFIFQKGQHGLVASVDAIKITDGEGALMGEPMFALKVLDAAEYLHAEPVKYLK
jgi:hypothetical protein